MKARFAFSRVLIFGVALLAAFGFVGCSDSVTPNDDITVTQEDVAYQSGYVAFAVVEVLPFMGDRAAVPEEIILGSPFGGSFWHDTVPNERVWTDADHILTLDLGGEIVTIEFDITAVGTDPYVANGTGTLTAGSLAIAFTVVDVTVPAGGGYPISGTILIMSSGHSATITFDNGTAIVVIGELTFTIDLSDGTITEL